MFNRLKFSKVYLIGPMDHNREKGRGWRTEISKWLIDTLGVISFDPYNKPILSELNNYGSVIDTALEDDISYARRVEAIANRDIQLARRLTKPIVATDLRMVDHSDFLICYFDVDSKPCGTIDEIVTAANQNKPIIMMCPQGITNIPQWLWGRIRPEIFFETWDDVKSYLVHIAYDKHVDTLDKWKFFDLEKQILTIVEQEYTIEKR